jgi:protein required for attachment to host cells
MKAGTSWVLIADGARARIVRLKNTNHETGVQMDDLVFETDHRRTGEIMSDRPGRSFASEGARRSAMEYRTEPEREQEARFAGTIVDDLDRRLRAHEFDRLSIVAEPRMLGTLRQKLSPALRQAVVAEVAKDLTKLPRHELDTAIAALGIR